MESIVKALHRSLIWLALVGCLCLVRVAEVQAAPQTAPAAEATSEAEAQEEKGLTVVDWIVITFYGVGLLGVGWYYSRRTRNTEDYLLGGRNMISSAVGLSLFATLLSTITYLSIPGELVAKGPVILWTVAAIPIAYVVVGYFLIPHFMRLRVTSAYEILETRLGIHIRLLACTIFLLTRLLWMGLIIYQTADKVIVVMMDWDKSTTPYVAAVIGLITVIYTSMGGLRAVVFTDVIQSFILLGGAILAIIMISVEMGGVTAWWPTEWSPTWDTQPLFSWDPHERVTVIGSIVYMTVWWICTAGSDQMAIQRYLATRDVKAARRVFLTTGIANIVVTICLASLGFALLGFFRANPQYLEAAKMTIAKDGDRMFPHFIVEFLPMGITGLVISGLLAAAMSSLSSGINSSCSVISVDFFDRFRKKTETEAHHMKRIRSIAVGSGLAAVLLSTMMGDIEGNITAVTAKTNHIFVAPLFALFFMALFVPFASPFGTGVGALAGCAVAVVIAFWDKITGGDPLSFQWISLISLIVNLGVAIPLCWVTAKKNKCEKPLDS